MSWKRLIANPFGILISRAFSQVLSFYNVVCRLIGATVCWDTVAVCLWLWLCRGFFYLITTYHIPVLSDCGFWWRLVTELFECAVLLMRHFYESDWYEHSLMNCSRLSSASSSSCFERFREIILVWRIRYLMHCSFEAR